MPRRRKPPPPLELSPPRPKPPEAAPRLPLGGGGGVQLVLEGTDLAAVEAAAAELKARFGARFAVTGRRSLAGGGGLRISACLLVRAGDALDAGA
ncbi:hypothetical protein [Crenalkalicoccus roseus]|uniref:hypothetical protein n=1 Tax=Crenalkalicoccus roseus TaxID=1485588 RepID=UPI001081C123|nr:hypothetical protein [Crenalkalicoccus roseus]